MDCPSITIHARKCYKALIDSGAAISLIGYSTYQLIDESFKIHIQPATTKLNTADRLSMTALGMAALHLRIVDFKFTHQFYHMQQTTRHWNNIWNRCTEEIFHYHMLGIRKRIATYKRMTDFFHIHQKLLTKGDNRNCKTNSQDTS